MVKSISARVLRRPASSWVGVGRVQLEVAHPTVRAVEDAGSGGCCEEREGYIWRRRHRFGLPSFRTSTSGTRERGLVAQQARRQPRGPLSSKKTSVSHNLGAGPQ